MTTETQTPGTDAAGDTAGATPATATEVVAASATQPEGNGAPQAGDTGSADQTAVKGPAQGETKPGEGEQKPGEGEQKPATAPAEYADFTAPEGVALNTEVVNELKAFAKSKGLTQDEAQKLVDLGIKNAQAQHSTIVDQIAQQQAAWLDSARVDKEIGGDKLDENRALAKRALDTFGTPELNKMLEESKLGDHPEVLRAFYRVGKAISEDKLVPGSVRPSANKPFYDKSNHTTQ